MMLHQPVQNHIGPGTPVEQVAHDVQPVHRQPLDDLTEPDNVGVRPLIADDDLDDLAVVQVLVVVLKVGVEQLVQNVAAVFRQHAAHMGAGVLGGHEPAQVDEP